MNRYCTKCCKEYDFKISSMDDLDNLICPVCGSRIDKNSRKPRDTETEDEIEEAIGEGFYTIFQFAYFFYLICGIIGVIAYFTGYYKLLYVETAVCLIMYFIRYGRGYGYYGFDIIWIALGSFGGYYFYGTPQGVCLGIMLGFIARHIFKTMILNLLSRFISWCSRL